MKSGDDAYCAVLIEHKSYKDPYAGFQIGEYLFSAYRHQIKNKDHFKIIIPILFYHHEQKWEFQPVEAFFEDKLQRFFKICSKV
jgi:predicted transposase/invertase (TIGR01784 family)